MGDFIKMRFKGNDIKSSYIDKKDGAVYVISNGNWDPYRSTKNGENMINYKDMDLNMRKFETLIYFGDFVEAMELFKPRMQDQYMQIALNVLSHFQETTHNLDDEIKSLKSQLKSCRNDLFNLRKERGDTNGTIEMHLETGANLDEIPVENFFKK